jgi:hypothetical protein
MFGADCVIWGINGSPQWQIEAMRRLEIPEDMQSKYGFPTLGDAPVHPALRHYIQPPHPVPVRIAPFIDSNEIPSFAA